MKDFFAFVGACSVATFGIVATMMAVAVWRDRRIARRRQQLRVVRGGR